MFSPYAFSQDFQQTWLQNLSSSNLTPNSNANRQLFAPPLLAYSVECPGADLVHLEYLIKTKNVKGVTYPGAGTMMTLSPLVNNKLKELAKIRNYGVNTIAPIGINKTLVELQLEEARRHNISDQLEASEEHPEGDTDFQMSGIGPIVDNTANSILEPEPDVDLDSAVPNADLENEFFDEGFMAEEVEYQDDHLIIQDSRIVPQTNSGSLMSAVQRVEEESENVEDEENSGYLDDENGEEDMIME